MQRIKGRGRRLHHPEKLTVASSFLVARHAEQRCGAARSDMLHCRHTDRSAFLAWPLIYSSELERIESGDNVEGMVRPRKAFHIPDPEIPLRTSLTSYND